MHPTLGILARFQAFFYASAFFQSDGVPPPAPARVTQTVGRLVTLVSKTESLFNKSAKEITAIQNIRILWLDNSGVHVSFIVSSYFLCLSFGFILILLFTFSRYIKRENYAESIAKLSDVSKERLIKTDKLLVGLFKIILWLTPLFLVFIPLALFFYLREFFLVTTICMVLFVVTIWQEYAFRKWLINYLESRAIPK